MWRKSWCQTHANTDNFSNHLQWFVLLHFSNLLQSGPVGKFYVCKENFSGAYSTPNFFSLHINVWRFFLYVFTGGCCAWENVFVKTIIQRVPKPKFYWESSSVSKNNGLQNFYNMFHCISHCKNTVKLAIFLTIHNDFIGQNNSTSFSFTACKYLALFFSLNFQRLLRLENVKQKAVSKRV